MRPIPPRPSSCIRWKMKSFMRVGFLPFLPGKRDFDSRVYTVLDFSTQDSSSAAGVPLTGPVHCRPNAKMTADKLLGRCFFFFFCVINTTGPVVRLDVLPLTQVDVDIKS